MARTDTFQLTLEIPEVDHQVMLLDIQRIFNPSIAPVHACLECIAEKASH